MIILMTLIIVFLLIVISFMVWAMKIQDNVFKILKDGDVLEIERIIARQIVSDNFSGKFLVDINKCSIDHHELLPKSCMPNIVSEIIKLYLSNMKGKRNLNFIIEIAQQGDAPAPASPAR
jgi:hypothetical protein